MKWRRAVGSLTYHHRHRGYALDHRSHERLNSPHGGRFDHLAGVVNGWPRHQEPA